MMRKMTVCSLVIGIIGSYVSTATAHINSIDNRTDGNLQATVVYRSCNDDNNVMVYFGTVRQIKAWGCCVKQPIFIRKIDGTNAGSTTTVHPSYTGAGISCTSNYVIVEDTKDGIKARLGG